MGFLDTVLPVQAKGPPAHDDFWYGDTSQMALSGVSINADSALRISTVYRCVAAVAADLAAMPFIIYSRQGLNKERAPGHPLYHVLHDQPNQWQTSYEWREMMMGHVLLRGNAYNIIQAGPRGFADQLIPLNPSRMKVEQLPNRRLKYLYAWEDGHGEAFTQDEIFHLKDFSVDGIMGLSKVNLARESFGLGMATESYGARVFAQDGTPGGVLHVDGELSDDASKRLERSWAQANTGLRRAHSVPVLEKGTKWEQVGLSNEDSQFLGTRSFQVEEMARWFGVPLHRIGHTEKSTSWGTGIEQFNLGYIAFTLIPWIRRWEQSVQKDLILAKDNFFAELLLDHLLRADITKRFGAYDRAIKAGFMSRNEARLRENMNTVEGLDDFLVPLNMATVSGGSTGPRPPTEAAGGGDGDAQDAASRTAMYKELFNLGAITPNEIREREGIDRVEGGDTLFVPLSLTPMERAIASDGSQASLQKWRRSTTLQGLTSRNIMTINEARQELGFDPVEGGESLLEDSSNGGGGSEKEEDPDADQEGSPGGAGAVDHRTHLIVQEAAARIVRKEVRAATSAMARADGDLDGYETWAFAWWADHRGFITGALHLDGNTADEYIEAHRHLDPDQLDESQDDRTYQLASLALGEERYVTA